MALYLIDGVLVRARNGHLAADLIGSPGASALRISEQGEDCVVFGKAPREVDVTRIDDTHRRYRNIDTGAERLDDPVSSPLRPTDSPDPEQEE